MLVVQATVLRGQVLRKVIKFYMQQPMMLRIQILLTLVLERGM